MFTIKRLKSHSTSQPKFNFHTLTLHYRMMMVLLSQQNELALNESSATILIVRPCSKT
jgi:hypothetical protein